MGKLSLIDLAGSERAAATENRGIRMVEVLSVCPYVCLTCFL